MRRAADRRSDALFDSWRPRIRASSHDRWRDRRDRRHRSTAAFQREDLRLLDADRWRLAVRTVRQQEPFCRLDADGAAVDDRTVPWWPRPRDARSASVLA